MCTCAGREGGCGGEREKEGRGDCKSWSGQEQASSDRQGESTGRRRRRKGGHSSTGLPRPKRPALCEYVMATDRSSLLSSFHTPLMMLRAIDYKPHTPIDYSRTVHTPTTVAPLPSPSPFLCLSLFFLLHTTSLHLTYRTSPYSNNCTSLSLSYFHTHTPPLSLSVKLQPLLPIPKVVTLSPFYSV